MALAFVVFLTLAISSLCSPVLGADPTTKQVRRIEIFNASYHVIDGCMDASIVASRQFDDGSGLTFTYYTVSDTCSNKLIASGGANIPVDAFVGDDPERDGLSLSIDVTPFVLLDEIVGTPLIANITWRADNDTVTDSRSNGVTIERKNNPGRYLQREDSHVRSAQATGTTNLFPVVTGPNVQAEMSWGTTVYTSYPRSTP